MIKKHFKFTEGFTIVEVIVVLFIFTIISRVVLFHYKDFDQRIVLDTTGQDIALLFRKAQSEATSGRYPLLTAAQTVPSTSWKPSYGVYFSTARPNYLFYFYDGDTDKIPYNMDPTLCVNPTTPTECLDVYTIANSNTIQSICLEDGNGNCGVTVQDAAILFTRPFPDADIKYNYTLPFVVGTTADSVLRITISGPNGSRYIRVTPLGQISVQSQ